MPLTLLTLSFACTDDTVGNEYWDHLFRKAAGAEIDTKECCKYIR